MNGTLEMINRMQADGMIGKYAKKMRDRNRAIAAAGLRKAARPKPANDGRSKP